MSKRVLMRGYAWSYAIGLVMPPVCTHLPSTMHARHCRYLLGPRKLFVITSVRTQGSNWTRKPVLVVVSVELSRECSLHTPTAQGAAYLTFPESSVWTLGSKEDPCSAWWLHVRNTRCPSQWCQPGPQRGSKGPGWRAVRSSARVLPQARIRARCVYERACVEHCKACETRGETYRCPLCGMTGKEIVEKRREDQTSQDTLF